MNGVLGMAQLLLGTPLQADQRNMVATLKSSGEHLLMLLNDVLDLSRIEAGHIDIHPVAVGMSELTGQVIRMMEPQFHTKALRLDFEDGLPRGQRFLVDSLRYRQILANLLSNAAKFTQVGGAKVKLSPSTHGGILLEVSDTGIGISSAKLGDIFGPFTLADTSPARQHSGTGLGLTISRHLVHLMGGKIEVESEVGKGTTFHVELPLPIAEAQSPGELEKERLRKRAEETDSIPKPRPPSPARILLVEDHPTNRKVVMAMLENFGYECEAAENALTGLRMLEENAFDLVFMDCQMPSLDGYEATRMLRRSDSPNRALPVIALTANAMPGNRERCLAAGMNDFIAKPVKMAELEALCGKWIPTASLS